MGTLFESHSLSLFPIKEYKLSKELGVGAFGMVHLYELKTGENFSEELPTESVNMPLEVNITEINDVQEEPQEISSSDGVSRY